MHTIVQIILSFIGWYIIYFGLLTLDKVHNQYGMDFWYIKPEKWTSNFGLTWLLTLFLVFLTI